MPIPPSSEQSVPSNINDNAATVTPSQINNNINVSKKGRKRKSQQQQQKVDPIKEKFEVAQRVQKLKTTQELVKAYNISFDDRASVSTYNYQNDNNNRKYSFEYQSQQQQQQYQQQQLKKKNRTKSNQLSLNNDNNLNRSQNEGVSSSNHNHLNSSVNNRNNNNNNNNNDLTIFRLNNSTTSVCDRDYNQVNRNNDDNNDDEIRTKNILMQRFLSSTSSSDDLTRSKQSIGSNRNIVDEDDDNDLVEENGHFIFKENSNLNSSNYLHELIENNSNSNLNRYKDRNRNNNEFIDAPVDNFVLINKVDLEIRDILSQLPPLRKEDINWSDYDDNEEDDDEEEHDEDNNILNDVREIDDNTSDQKLINVYINKNDNFSENKHLLSDTYDNNNDDDDINNDNEEEITELSDLSPNTSISPAPNSSTKHLPSRSLTSPSTTVASTATTVTNKSKKTRRKNLLPVTKETLDRLCNDKIEYVNGTYNNDGQWTEWHEMSDAYNPVSGELLHILPYVNTTW